MPSAIPLSLAAMLMLSSAAIAEPIETVVVTAEKHEEAINTIGMSIQAVTGETLKAQRITSVQDLGTVVPSFNVSQGYQGVPIFTLRGIGFNTINLSATSTVGTYVDEVAYAYPFMMSGPLFDMQRVEVLKGPQGTLYGRNTTAGLIDFITNKPTDTFAASLTAEAGNYGTYNFEGFINGALSDTLDGRLAFRTEDSNEGWQKSNTRPGDSLGEKHNYAVRGELVWKPTDALTVSLTVAGWINQSDSVAAQAIGLTASNGPGSPQYCLQAPGPFSPGYAPTGTCPLGTPFLGGAPTDFSMNAYLASHVPNSGSQADWEPAAQRMADIGTGLGIHKPLAENDDFYSVVGRVDYAFSDTLSLVSLTSYNHVKRDGVNDWSGAPYEVLVQNEQGTIGSFSEELRLQGDEGSVRWIAGGYYASDDIFDGNRTMLGQNANVPFIRINGLALLANPGANAVYNTAGYTALDMSQAFRTYADRGAINSHTWSVFANADWQINDQLKLSGGLRYTQDSQKFAGCSYDFNGNMLPNVNVVNRYLYTSGLGIPNQIVQGGCVTFNDATVTTFGIPARQFGELHASLDEDNIAGRITLDWTPQEGTLVYATISRGFKAGDIPIVAANIASQERPAKQERLMSYEAGIKTTLADGHVQLNFAGFYYDYGNKQLSVLFKDPIYTVLGRLDNVPTAQAYGFDTDVTWAISDELTASATATYVQTRVGDYLGVSNTGGPQQFAGAQFPNSPHWQGALTLNYQRPLNDTLGLSVLVNEHLQAKSCADLCTDNIFKINGYGLLNANISLYRLDNSWRVSLWGRNLTDTYYWNAVAGNADLNVRFPGMTRTYGVSLTYNVN